MVEIIQQARMQINALKEAVQLLIDDKNLVVDAGGYILNDVKTEHLYQKVEGLADECLITDTGHPNFVNHHMFKEASGFTVIKGEADTSGWLTGVIVTPKGMIVFG
jgi:hypothetical protein